MIITIRELPEDIINQVNKENWEILFDDYMTFQGDYVYTTETMKEFIKSLLNAPN